jgi:hypothetical protein
MRQKIVVYLRLNEWDTNLILSGLRLASNFGKELCLFYQVSGAYHPEQTDQQLKNYRENIQKAHPDIPVSILVGPFRKGKLAAILADEHEAIMLVAGASVFKKLANSLLNSPIPFLFIPEQTYTNPDFVKIVYPVDLRKQNKDVLKWILYFGKYHHSEIVAIGANDKSLSNRNMVASHLTSLKKMLLKYGIIHHIYRGRVNSLRIHNEGFEAAIQLHAGILVLLGSSYITLLDLVIGLPEEKIIKHAREMAVLVVNPKRETYLVCE